MKLSKKFKAFCINIIKKHEEQEFVDSFQSNLTLKTNEECRDFLAYNINTMQAEKIFEILRNRSFRKSWQILKLINREFGKKTQMGENLEEICEKLKRQTESQNKIEILKEPYENDYNDDYENKLDFTSDLSLFGYSSNEETNHENYSKLSIEKRKNNFDNSFVVNRKSLNLNRNDLNYKKKSFATSSPVNECEIKKWDFIHSKIDPLIKSKERSPSPSNISKLNLFKNIFDDELQGYIFNNNNNNVTKERKNYKFKSTFQSSNKFYKLNDLVSVMINEDYFQT